MAYRRTPTVQARLDATRERIVDAALHLVAAGGWGAVSVAAVARTADVATGTVYRHLADKDALSREAFRRAAGRELAHVAAVAERDGPALDRLAAALHAFADRARRAPRLAHALLVEPAGEVVEVERRAHRAGYREVFARLLEEAVLEGTLAEHDRQLHAAMLVGAVGEALVGPDAPLATASRPAGDRGAPSGSRGGPDLAELVAACLRLLPTTTSPSDRTEIP